MRTNRQTDDEANSRFSQFCKRAWSDTLFLNFINNYLRHVPSLHGNCSTPLRTDTNVTNYVNVVNKLRRTTRLAIRQIISGLTGWSTYCTTNPYTWFKRILYRNIFATRAASCNMFLTFYRARSDRKLWAGGGHTSATATVEKRHFPLQGEKAYHT